MAMLNFTFLIRLSWQDLQASCRAYSFALSDVMFAGLYIHSVVKHTARRNCSVIKYLARPLQMYQPGRRV